MHQYYSKGWLQLPNSSQSMFNFPSLSLVIKNLWEKVKQSTVKISLTNQLKPSEGTEMAFHGNKFMLNVIVQSLLWHVTSHS